MIVNVSTTPVSQYILIISTQVALNEIRLEVPFRKSIININFTDPHCIAKGTAPLAPRRTRNRHTPAHGSRSLTCNLAHPGGRRGHRTTMMPRERPDVAPG